MQNRRRFITLVPFAGAAFVAACSKESTTTPAAPAPMSPPAPSTAPSSTEAAPATTSGADLPMLLESDPLAVSLGYVAQASRADIAKYKNYVEGQACGNCSLYAGKASDPQAACPLFAGKAVLAAGWCSAYVKRVG